MRRGWLVGIFGLFVGTGNFQHPDVTGYLHEVFEPRNSTPIAVRLIPVQEVVCDTQKPLDQSEGRINPQSLHFDDALNPGQGCVTPFEAETLELLPDGDGYVSTLTAYGRGGPIAPRSEPSQRFGRWRVVPERPERGVPTDPRVTGLTVR